MVNRKPIKTCHYCERERQKALKEGTPTSAVVTVPPVRKVRGMRRAACVRHRQVALFLDGVTW